MTDILSPKKTEYPGDEAFAEFLKKHKCPLPFHIFKFRFWGSITTIALQVSPASEIKHIWDNELPEFENEDEAQSFFDTIFSLWNGLSEMNMAGRRLHLSQRHGLDNPDGLGKMIERRLDELNEGFISGFTGNMRIDDKETPKTNSCLVKFLDMIEELEELQFGISDDKTDYSTVRKGFLSLDKSAQRILDNLVKAANAQRNIKQLSGMVH